MRELSKLSIRPSWYNFYIYHRHSNLTAYVQKRAKTFISLSWRAAFAFVSAKILDFLNN